MSRANRLEYIDALRGWAILAVILVHVWIWTGASSDFLNRLAPKGAYGVQLFYLISAFTLLLSLNHQRQNNTLRWRDYFIRRFFRIAPLFYLAICLYGPMWQFVPRYWMPEGISTWHVLASFTFVHGWHPLWVNSIVPGGWSMAVEMTFYCLFPLLCLQITTLKRAIVFVLISLFLGMMISDWAYHHYLPLVPQRFSYVINNFAYVYMPSAQLCVFALGFVLYFLFAQKWHQTLTGTAAKFYLLSAIILMLVLTYWNPGFLPEFFVFSCVFILLIIGFSATENRLFINSVLIHIGRLSYSLYLVHFGVIYLLKIYLSDFTIAASKDLTLFVVFVIVTLISLFLSQISYQLIEKPSIALGKRLIERL